MSTINTEAPALAIEWPWRQALKFGGDARWISVINELIGQATLLCHLNLNHEDRDELIDTIEFLSNIAGKHLYG